MIKVGVIGAGHLGKIHLNILNNSDFELVGFYDTDVFNSEKLSQERGYSFYKVLEQLIENIDAAVIVSPTTTHFEIAKKALEKIDDVHYSMLKDIGKKWRMSKED